jgi:hypothetical protein
VSFPADGRAQAGYPGQSLAPDRVGHDYQVVFQYRQVTSLPGLPVQLPQGIGEGAVETAGRCRDAGRPASSRRGENVPARHSRGIALGEPLSHQAVEQVSGGRVTLADFAAYL